MLSNAQIAAFIQSKKFFYNLNQCRKYNINIYYLLVLGTYSSFIFIAADNIYSLIMEKLCMDAYLLPTGIILSLVILNFFIGTRYFKGKYGEWLVSRTLFKFQNPLKQSYGHCRVISQTLGIHDKHIHSLVVITGDAKFKSHKPKQVFFGPGFISYIESFTEQVFRQDDVMEITELINHMRLQESISTDMYHIKQLKLRHKK